ncbi:hypothetical protein [Endobacterium cereale]|uniref:hypothetical protein n=1 Tax=Endobacterium cereale TaxID=2663029 RepID=UPI002B45CC23|nr:hypothetical protein [Endobacterium cereale]MEB2845907.1 hypothetical protein [Endobacterium cereale]
MSPAEMEAACKDSLAGAVEFGLPRDKACVILVTPPGFKPQQGFPRGYLLQVKDDGRRIKSYPALRVLAWIRKAAAA